MENLVLENLRSQVFGGKKKHANIVVPKGKNFPGRTFICGWPESNIRQRDGNTNYAPTTENNDLSVYSVTASTRDGGDQQLYDYWEYESNNGGATPEFLDYVLQKYDGANATNHEFEAVVRQRMEGPYREEKVEFLRQRKCMDDYLKTIDDVPMLRENFKNHCLKETGKISWWDDVRKCPFVLLLSSSVRSQFVEFVTAWRQKLISDHEKSPESTGDKGLIAASRLPKVRHRQGLTAGVQSVTTPSFGDCPGLHLGDLRVKPFKRLNHLSYDVDFVQDPCEQHALSLSPSSHFRDYKASLVDDGQLRYNLHTTM